MMNYPNFSSHGYEVKWELGKNLTGGRVTYLAKDINTRQTAVIKQFQFAQAMGTWRDYDAIHQEIQVLQKLNHPSIPRYLNSFDTSTGFCLVQEYKNAPSLAKYGDLTPEDIQDIAVQCLEILVYLQRQQPYIIHRDIKPENILFSRDKKVYLVDFGLAKLGEGEVASTIAKGTFGFMPPEQIHQRQLTKGTDLYSLGATLICLLTERESTTIGDLIDDNERIKFKSKLPKLSSAFVKWLERMVERKLDKRFQNAEEALKALHSSRTDNNVDNIFRFSPKLVKPKLFKISTISFLIIFVSMLGAYQIKKHKQEQHILAETERVENERKRIETEREHIAKKNHRKRIEAKIESIAAKAERKHIAAKAERERIETERRRIENERIQIETQRQLIEIKRGQIERERIQTETERIQTENERRRTENERIQIATVRELIAKEKAERERIAKEKAERERIAKEKAERERIAKQKAYKKRIAKAKAERERIEARTKPLIIRLQQTKACVNCDLSGANLRDLLIENVNLQNANLKGADLSGVKLRGANLSFAKLQKSRLEDADLKEANLQGAQLQKANLQYTDLIKANLKNANLQNANLNRAKFSSIGTKSAANLENANLQGAKLVNATLNYVNFKNTNLENADLSKASLLGANLDGANLDGARFWRSLR